MELIQNYGTPVTIGAIITLVGNMLVGKFFPSKPVPGQPGTPGTPGIPGLDSLLPMLLPIIGRLFPNLNTTPIVLPTNPVVPGIIVPDVPGLPPSIQDLINKLTTPAVVSVEDAVSQLVAKAMAVARNHPENVISVIIDGPDSVNISNEKRKVS